MGMWVRLLIQIPLDVNGRTRTYHPGDYVELGRQTAQRMIADGFAESPDGKLGDAELHDCGMVITGDLSRTDVQDAFKPLIANGMTVRDGLDPELESAGNPYPTVPYARTVFYDPDLPLRSALVPVGMHLLNTWEVVAAVESYDRLAAHVGSDADRARTAAIVGDLRVPLYDPRLLFMRKCAGSEALLAAYAEELDPEGDARLALLRALFRVKPLLLPVPTSWLAA